MTLGGLVFPFWNIQIIYIAYIYCFMFVIKDLLMPQDRHYFYLCFVCAYFGIFLVCNFKSLYYDIM